MRITVKKRHQPSNDLIKVEISFLIERIHDGQSLIFNTSDERFIDGAINEEIARHLKHYISQLNNAKVEYL